MCMRKFVWPRENMMSFKSRQKQNLLDVLNHLMHALYACFVCLHLCQTEEPAQLWIGLNAGTTHCLKQRRAKDDPHNEIGWADFEFVCWLSHYFPVSYAVPLMIQLQKTSPCNWVGSFVAHHGSFYGSSSGQNASQNLSHIPCVLYDWQQFKVCKSAIILQLITS